MFIISWIVKRVVFKWRHTLTSTISYILASCFFYSTVILNLTAVGWRMSDIVIKITWDKKRKKFLLIWRHKTRLGSYVISNGHNLIAFISIVFMFCCTLNSQILWIALNLGLSTRLLINDTFFDPLPSVTKGYIMSALNRCDLSPSPFVA